MSPTLLQTRQNRAALTVRELEILRGMAVGETNRQTSRRLYVGEETIRTQVKRLLRKMNARNRAHAVAIGLRADVI